MISLRFFLIVNLGGQVEHSVVISVSNGADSVKLTMPRDWRHSSAARVLAWHAQDLGLNPNTMQWNIGHKTVILFVR